MNALVAFGEIPHAKCISNAIGRRFPRDRSVSLVQDALRWSMEGENDIAHVDEEVLLSPCSLRYR